MVRKYNIKLNSPKTRARSVPPKMHPADSKDSINSPDLADTMDNEADWESPKPARLKKTERPPRLYQDAHGYYVLDGNKKNAW